MSGALAFAGHLGLRVSKLPLLVYAARSKGPLVQIEALAEHGFKGVQDVFLKARSVSQQKVMSSRMAALGLSMGTFNGDPQHWNTPLWSSRDEDARFLLRQNLQKSIEVAERMGGGAAVCVCGADPSRPHDAQLSGMIDNLKELGETAAKSGLTLLVEPVAKAWIPGLLIGTLQDAASVVRAVNLPSVQLLYDTGHVALAGEDVLTGLQDHWDIVGGVQVSDVPGRIDIGVGTLDWTAIFGWLSSQGYSGLVEVEHDPMERSRQGGAKLLERLRTLAPVGSFSHPR